MGKALTTMVAVKERLEALDWTSLERSLWERGYAETDPILTPEECAAMTALYDDDRRFRSRVDMARHRFGVGEYKYFADPLPELVTMLRVHLYPPLARVANAWADALGEGSGEEEGRGEPRRGEAGAGVPGGEKRRAGTRDDLAARVAAVRAHYPETLEAFRARCAAAGQTKPTPLVLRYTAGGYNCLHQDVYGDVAFPLQAVVMLSRPGVDYAGGEFLLVEQRPRAQSAGEVVQAPQGAIVLFTTRVRPMRGTRGFYRANVRHGVSRIRRGTRYAMGIIFHDAR